MRLQVFVSLPAGVQIVATTLYDYLQRDEIFVGISNIPAVLSDPKFATADEPVELLGEEYRFLHLPVWLHVLTNRNRVRVLVGANQIRYPVWFRSCVVDKADDVATCKFGTLRATVRDSLVLVVAVEDNVLLVTEVFANALEDILVAVDDKYDLDRILLLG